MKAKHIFWGLLFISLGVLILANNIWGINWNWISLWKLWPLLFILWGIAIMVKNNSAKIIIAGIAGIVFAISLFASFYSVVHLTTGDFNIVFDDKSDSRYEITDYSEPFTDKIKSAEFHFKAGAGSFVTENDTVSVLFKAHTEGIKDNYSLTNEVGDDNAVLNMEMKGTHLHFGKKGIRNRVEMAFNPAPVWDLNYDVGAASVDLNLTGVKVKRLNISMGAASLNVKLGEKYNRTDVNIETGASKVEINVPVNAGCEIKTAGALNSTHFPDFKKITGDLYRTDNFDTAANKIFINIDSGVSSLTINRYSGSW